MNNKFLFVLLLFGFNKLAQSQVLNHIDYKKDCDFAYRLAIDSADYESSILQLTFVKKKHTLLYGEEYLLMAYCYNKLNKKTKSAKCIKSAWSVHSFDLSCVMQIEEIQPSLIMEGFNKRQNRIVGQGFANFSKLKTTTTDSLYAVFEALNELDQIPRVKIPKTASDTLLFDQEIFSTDSINLAEFKHIIYKLGFPGEWLMPGKSAIAGVLLVHSSYYEDFFNEMKPVFYNEVLNGRMPPSEYALWIDRHNYVFNKPLVYGILAIPSQYTLSESEKLEIQKNRIEIGLIKNFPIPSTQLTF